jgi:Flp pilus assembly protein TadG
MNFSPPPRPVQTRSALRGSVAAWVAVLAVVLIGFAGLAIDGSWYATAGQQLQAAADAASLAGAGEVKTDTAPFNVTIAKAAQTALANQAAGASVQLDPGDVEVGTYDLKTKAFTPTNTKPDAVKVTAHRTQASGNPVSLFFGGLFGKPTADTTRTSIAVVDSVGEPLVLALDPSGANALQVRNQSKLVLDRGIVMVNSPANCALGLDSNVTVEADAIRVVGQACPPGGQGTGVTTAIFENVVRIVDPYASVPDPHFVEPPLPPIKYPFNKHPSHPVYNPGYYEGIILAGNESVVLNPGVYVIGSVGVDLSGASKLQGQGVVLYLKLPKAKLKLHGNATIQLTPPTSGPYRSLAIFFHRQNQNTSEIEGSANVDIEGCLYGACQTLIFKGSNLAKVGRLVIHRMEFTNKADVQVTGLGIPITPQPQFVFLVE